MDVPRIQRHPRGRLGIFPRVPPDRRPELVTFFRGEHRPAMARQPGFLGARLLGVAGADDELQIELRASRPRWP